MDHPVTSAIKEINWESHPSESKYLRRIVMRHPADPMASIGNESTKTMGKPGGRRVSHIVKPGTSAVVISIKESNPTYNKLLRRMLRNTASKSIASIVGEELKTDRVTNQINIIEFSNVKTLQLTFPRVR